MAINLRIRRLPECFVILLLLLAASRTTEAEPANKHANTTVHWPSFRGPEGRGVAEAKIATSWNADPAAGPVRNIRWKTPIPGLAHSSPSIWGNRLFVTTAVSSAGRAPLKVGLYGSGDSADDNAEQSWILYCLDKNSGKVLWQRVAHQGIPRTKRHTKATHANTTPVTDGKRLIVFFGSEGVHAYGLDGKPLWKKDLGTFAHGPRDADLQWGNASSPVLFEDKVILQCDQRKGALLLVLSAKTGQELWRVPRDGVSNHSWATPAVVTQDGRTQIICNGWPYITGYDLATGKELWRLKSGGDIPVPTPVFAHGLIYVTNAHGGLAPLYAIKPGASGDITPEGERAAGSRAWLAWFEPRNGAYMQTPVVWGDLLYSCSDRGVLKVYDARSGQLRYSQRLGSGTTGFTASPIAADSKVLFTSEEGEVYVLKAGPAYELLSKNLLGEIAMASPAISEAVLFYRTRAHVIAIEGEDERSKAKKSKSPL
ncbi:MAG: PQQ-binding-like beta-propeller repeat protein [Acidobacteria bacterium]|nr:PQQ-binding-like beta-propeller repeat protein [Acidobacteriota bacterium]MCI0623985.1 PQQ-binding-like beta-propeller repeat protein [Acidobacteriota bacterium]